MKCPLVPFAEQSKHSALSEFYHDIRYITCIVSFYFRFSANKSGESARPALAAAHFSEARRFTPRIHEETRPTDREITVRTGSGTAGGEEGRE